MKTLVKNPRSLLISLALVAGTSLFSVGAQAGLFYNGYADIEFSLVNVARVGGPGNGSGTGAGPGTGQGPDPTSYSVTLSGGELGSDIFTSGAGFADNDTNIVPVGNLPLAEPVFQYSESYGGSSGTGSAHSYADTEFSIVFENFHQNALSFDLSFLSYVSADVYNNTPLTSGDDAGAYAEVSLFDDVNEILFSSAEAFVGGSMFSSDEVEHSMKFELAGGERYEIFGLVYSDGYAATVPEPKMFWLLALGLVTMLVRKKSLLQ